MPSFNQGRFLGKALESIAGQTFSDWELIIEDGGSQDGSIDLIREFATRHQKRVKWRSSPDGGQVAALNQGLALARGEILCYLNSDDEFFPEALQTVTDYFSTHPEDLILYGRADYVDENDALLKPYPVQKWDYSALGESCFICQPACFWRQGIYTTYGDFDQALSCAFDYEYWLRVGARENFVFLPQKLARSRYHIDAKSSALKAQAVEEAFQTACRYFPQQLAPTWARKLGVARASQFLRPNSANGRLKFYLKYWQTMLQCRAQISSRDYASWLKLLLPPYPSALRRIADPLADFRDTDYSVP